MVSGIFATMKQITESIKVNKALLNKIRKHVKKTKQTIGGFYDLAAKDKLEFESQLDKASIEK